MLALFGENIPALIMPLSLNVYNAASKRNWDEFVAGRNDGQQLLSLLYRLACDCVWSKKEHWQEGHKFQTDTDECVDWLNSDTDLSESASQPNRELTAKGKLAEYLEAGYKKEHEQLDVFVKHYFLISSEQRLQESESRLIKTAKDEAKREIESQLANGHVNAVEFFLMNICNKRYDSALDVHVCDEVIAYVTEKYAARVQSFKATSSLNNMEKSGESDTEKQPPDPTLPR